MSARYSNRVRANLLWIVLVGAALTVAASCDNPTEPTISEDPTDTSEARQQLAASRERFRTTVGESYQYDYRNNCFCGPDTRLPVRVTIRNGARVSVVTLEDAAPIPPNRWGDFLTVEEAFDTIEQALNDGAATIQAVYDETLGYPREVFIDFDERIADEEQGFTFNNLAPTP